jgi:nucleotide-binding universal stress UspA family protein
VLGIRTILHPTDFSENSQHAFQAACMLARDSQARLLLLHVMMPSAAPLMTGPPPDPLRRIESQDALARFPWPQPADTRIQVEHRLAEGSPAHEILRLAHAEPCELIVMGSHGRTGLRRVLTGSVAEAVLRAAECAVMIVKTPPPAIASSEPATSTEPHRRLILEKIISGGQTGADQAGWRAAKALGISTGGWMPKGFLTEDGPRAELAKQYGAVEMPSENLVARTEQNVEQADATLWFGETTTSGAHATVGACQRGGKPCMPIDPAARFEPAHVAAWLTANHVRTLNVAGNRESDEPGIGNRVELFLREVFRQLGHERG